MTDASPAPPESQFAKRLRGLLPALSKSEARIAQFLLLNEADLNLETGASVAAKANVSEVTVSRFLRRIGYKGMTALKEDLRLARLEDAIGLRERHMSLLTGDLPAVLTREAEAIFGLATQLAGAEWNEAMEKIWAADEVYVTGFQTIRGLAEDFARRLAIARDRVRILSAHDSGLSEWIAHDGQPPCRRILILIDILPYAREAETLARICRRVGIDLVIVTDEVNSWAYKETRLVFHAVTQVGAFLESTGPLATLLNLIVHAVAGKTPERTRARIDAWTPLFRDLDIY